MAHETKIEWAQASWNPWYGCDRVSPGCAHCYAEAWAKRSGRSFDVQRAAPSTFAAPLHWPQARIIFTCSLGDFFHDEADGWRDDAWSVIRQTPQHTYLILTKRPALIDDRLPDDWPLPNAWLGVSAESQRWADARIPALLDLPAAGRFVSCEPLLGPIDFYGPGSRGPEDGDPCSFSALSGTNVCDPPIPGLDWIIVGGESGPGCRPMKLEWARDIVSACRGAGVPVFVKQLGRRVVIPNDSFSEWPADGDDLRVDDAWEPTYQGEPVEVRLADAKGGDPSEWPEDLRVRERPVSQTQAAR